MAEDTQTIRDFFKTEKEHIDDNNQETSQALTEEDMLRIFIGPNSDKFVNLYKNPKAKWTTKFNFVVLLFPQAWFFYRKLYLSGVAILLLPIILFSFFPTTLTNSGLLGLAGALTVVANQLYVQYALKQIKKLKEQGWNEEELKQRLASKGGTSPVGGAFGALITASLMALYYFPITTASLPNCQNPEAQEVVRDLLVENMEKKGTDPHELILSDFKEVEHTEKDRQLCAFVAQIKDEKIELYTAMTWANENQGRYQVQVSSVLDELLKK